MSKSIWLGVGLLVAAIAACGGDDPPTCEETGVSDVPATGNQSSGDVVFNQTCVACHGMDGNTPQVTGATNMSVGVPGKTREQLALTIRCGKGNMAAIKTLTPQDIADVVTYVQATFP